MKDGTQLDLSAYWAAALAQRAEEMAGFFAPGAQVLWPNTNERFTAEEFIRANCEYPGSWNGEIERIETLANLIITAVHVYSYEGDISCHVTSFIKIKAGKIASIDEYWGDDAPAPQWRADMYIGTPIHKTKSL